jgi:hypothetical protein
LAITRSTPIANVTPTRFSSLAKVRGTRSEIGREQLADLGEQFATLVVRKLFTSDDKRTGGPLTGNARSPFP